MLFHLESPPVLRVPRLTVLVDATDDLALLSDLAAAGVDGFQVRPHGATVTVCDRVDVALAAGADGVHLGAEDLPVTDVRRLLDAVRPGMLVGATCRDRDAVVRAAGDGASYAGLGPVRTSGSKVGLSDPLGVAAVRAAAGVLPRWADGRPDAWPARPRTRCRDRRPRLRRGAGPPRPRRRGGRSRPGLGRQPPGRRHAQPVERGVARRGAVARARHPELALWPALAGRLGVLLVGSHAGDLQQVQQQAALLDALDQPVELLGSRDTRRLEPCLDHVAGGALLPDDAASTRARWSPP